MYIIIFWIDDNVEKKKYSVMKDIVMLMFKDVYVKI